MSKHEKIEELEQRVEELEDQTDSPEQTSNPDVSRRRMLQGAGLLGVGGLLGGSAAYSKPAQAEVADGTLKGIGQIGTDDERVGKLFVDNVDNFSESRTFETVTTDRVDVVPHDNRDLWSQEDQFINIPDDYPTIQDAVDDMPYFLRHEFRVVPDADYDGSEEDIYVPPTIAPRQTLDVDSESTLFRIEGADGTNYTQVGSIYVDTMVGMQTRLGNLEMTGTSPFDNETSCINVYGSPGRVILNSIDFRPTSSSKCILSYSSNLSVSNIDLGNEVANLGMLCKHGGNIYVGGPVSGTVNEHVLQAGAGEIRVDQSEVPLEADTVGDSARIESTSNGIATGAYTAGVTSGSYNINSVDVRADKTIPIHAGWMVIFDPQDVGEIESIPDGKRGTELRLHIDSSSSPVTLVHEADNADITIRLKDQQDVTINGVDEVITLVRATSTRWVEVSRSF